MEINVNINEKGIIVCSTKDRKKNKYCNFSEVKDYIIKSLKTLKKVDIIDGNMYLTFKHCRLNIINYKKVKNKDLNLVIEKAKSFKEKERKDFLRKRKIKRVSAFTGAVILSIGFCNANLLDNKNDIEFVDSDEIISYVESDKEKIEEIYVINESNDDTLTYNLEFDSRVESEKYKVAKAYYYDFIKTISPEYGIDPRIILAIATQESGMHDKNENGPAMGLMQIELSVWDNYSITAYNYSKNQNETLHITKEKLKDLEFNVRVGCMIFQDCLKKSNNNLLVAIQMYNFGYGNMSTVLKDYYKRDSINMNEAILNLDDDWIYSRGVINEGDNLYLEHVLSYIEDLNDIQCINCNNKEVMKYNINSENVRNLTI